MMGVALAMVGLTANAQSITPLQNAKKYNRTLGLNNVRNLPDAQLKQIGEKVSANGFPTRNTANRLLKAAKAKSSRMAKASSQIIDSRVSAANYTSTDTLFWENFEEWDGETMPYIPTSINKWSTKSNIDNLTPYISNGLCPTWTTFRGDGYYVPYAKEGDFMLVCMFGGEAYGTDGTSVIAPAPQQDEWLVTPTINAISSTNYLSFDICYAPWDTHFFVEGTDSVLDMNRIAYDVEVLITTSTRTTSYNADDYTQVYKLSDMVDKEIAGIDVNNSEEVDQLYYMTWRHIQIPLAEYDNKNIRVAFRYTGTKGGSILIDAIRVSDLLPVAKYDIPQGAFYYGFSEQANLFNIKVGLIPAYKQLVWNNYSNIDSKSYAWSYINNGEVASSSDYDLLMPAQKPTNSMVDMPELTASSFNRKDAFSAAYYKVGGNAHYSYFDGESSVERDFYVGNFDPTKQFWTGQISSNPSNPIYAFGTGGGAFYGQLSNYYYNAVDGIGNFYEAPASPYVFNKVLVPLGEFFNLGATLACTLYKVENGNTITDEVIAQATVTDGIQISGGWYLVFEFSEPIVMDDAMFILIDGFSNSNVIELAPLSQVLNHDNGKSYAFVKLNTYDGKYVIVDVANLLASVEGGGNMMVSHCIGMNAVFPYLHSMDGDVFAAASAGEIKSFAIDSYWNPQTDWTITASDAWVKAESVVDEAAQTVSVKISADALPADKEGRSATVKISALGCEEVITVLQGSEITGIEGIANDKNFNSIDGTYTLSGQRVNSADAKNGVFLVKKNGKYVKVMK